MWGDIAIAFLLAFIVSFMATPYTIKIAQKIGAVDVPKDQRRMHKKAMPKFGGPAVILGFIISVIYIVSVMSIEHSINLFNEDAYGMKLLGMFLRYIGNINNMRYWRYNYNKTISKTCRTDSSGYSGSFVWY